MRGSMQVQGFEDRCKPVFPRLQADSSPLEYKSLLWYHVRLMKTLSGGQG